jgi:hypothetical protein
MYRNRIHIVWDTHCVSRGDYTHRKRIHIVYPGAGGVDAHCVSGGGGRGCTLCIRGTVAIHKRGPRGAMCIRGRRVVEVSVNSAHTHFLASSSCT